MCYTGKHRMAVGGGNLLTRGVSALLRLFSGQCHPGVAHVCWTQVPLAFVPAVRAHRQAMARS